MLRLRGPRGREGETLGVGGQGGRKGGGPAVLSSADWGGSSHSRRDFDFQGYGPVATSVVRRVSCQPVNRRMGNAEAKCSP